MQTLTTLFSIARIHLKDHGRLVFWWYPLDYEDDPTEETIREDFLRIQTRDATGERGCRLQFVSATPQASLTGHRRWLCVFVKTYT